MTSTPRSNRHPTWTQSYKARAHLPGTSPLTGYLLRLISLKRSNLCLSADVSTTSELLSLAEEVGDSICLLKTHADIINDFGDKTVRRLREIARRKKFLVFEDRKFGDIGSTVQRQYTSGPLSIAKWAEITNAHIFPGPAIVAALKNAASAAISAYNSAIHTEITAASPSGSPHLSPALSNPADDDIDSVETIQSPLGTAAERSSPVDDAHLGVDADAAAERDLRKQSIVSISTTISTRSEPISPQPTPGIEDDGASIESAPYLRALLLLAEMSSEGNLLTGAYTEQCVQIARQHKDFVMGFIAQRSLNAEAEDNFITMTPGVSLPPPGKQGSAESKGDGLGQQYNTPRKIVFEQGADVIIVGRGIMNADNRAKEAERYRREAWAAYEERVGASN